MTTYYGDGSVSHNYLTEKNLDAAHLQAYGELAFSESAQYVKITYRGSGRKGPKTTTVTRGKDFSKDAILRRLGWEPIKPTQPTLRRRQ